MGVGMGSLSANLSKESGGRGAVGMGVQDEEWDGVRKEIRAIKGLLLNRYVLVRLNVHYKWLITCRRSFASITPSASLGKGEDESGG